MSEREDETTTIFRLLGDNHNCPTCSSLDFLLTLLRLQTLFSFSPLSTIHLNSTQSQPESFSFSRIFRFFTEKIRDLNLSVEKADNLTQIINMFLEEQNVPILTVDFGAEKLHTNWDFFNSFFFAITVVTTIGYGHLAPSTTLGRCFTLVYALFGIPMTGILLGAIGDRFSRCFLNEVTFFSFLFSPFPSSPSYFLSSLLYLSAEWYF